LAEQEALNTNRQEMNGQRIDYILYRSSDSGRFTLDYARTTCLLPLVNAANGVHHSLSDHYGVMAVFTLGQAKSSQERSPFEPPLSPVHSASMARVSLLPEAILATVVSVLTWGVDEARGRARMFWQWAVGLSLSVALIMLLLVLGWILNWPLSVQITLTLISYPLLIVGLYEWVQALFFLPIEIHALERCRQNIMLWVRAHSTRPEGHETGAYVNTAVRERVLGDGVEEILDPIMDAKWVGVSTVTAVSSLLGRKNYDHPSMAVLPGVSEVVGIRRARSPERRRHGDDDE
jgi:hypothetical protein